MRRVVLLSLLGLLWAAPAEAQSLTVNARGNSDGFGRVLAIGDFKPERNPTLGAAIEAWGRPTSQRRRFGGTACKVTWRGLGVRALFATFGGGNACEPDAGRVQGARVVAPRRWRTAKGLRLGDPVRALHRLYPSARRVGRSYWLARGLSLIGDPTPYPVLSAATNGGFVVSFKLKIFAAGD